MSINIEKLSINEKVELFEKLYSDITAHGTNGDVHLAHINEYERKLLIAHGGCGTVNNETGLKQYFGGGGSSGGGSPERQTTITREAPEIEARKLALFDIGADSASTPVNIPEFQVAGPSPLEQQAFTAAAQPGIGQPLVQQGITSALNAQQTAMLPPDINAFMNPYMDNVIGEIQRQGQIQRQGIAANAIQSGAFGGGREGVQLAEQQGRELGTIGQAQAAGFGQALSAAQAQQAAQVAAQQNAAKQLSGFAGQQQQMAQADIQQAAQLGQAQRGIGQAALEAQRQTELARAYEPYQRVEFQKGIMTALPTAASQVTQAASPRSNPLAQTVGTGLGAYAAFSGLPKSA